MIVPTVKDVFITLKWNVSHCNLYLSLLVFSMWLLVKRPSVCRCPLSIGLLLWGPLSLHLSREKRSYFSQWKKEEIKRLLYMRSGSALNQYCVTSKCHCWPCAGTPENTLFSLYTPCTLHYSFFSHYRACVNSCINACVFHVRFAWLKWKYFPQRLEGHLSETMDVENTDVK